jgi:hypothetical protein
MNLTSRIPKEDILYSGNAGVFYGTNIYLSGNQSGVL